MIPAAMSIVSSLSDVIYIIQSVPAAMSIVSPVFDVIYIIQSVPATTMRVISRI